MFSPMPAGFMNTKSIFTCSMFYAAFINGAYEVIYAALINTYIMLQEMVNVNLPSLR